jgi:hypothetical protein
MKNFAGFPSTRAVLIAVVLSALFLGAGLQGEVFAQEEKPITLQAEAGFDGYIKAAKWIPLHISVENKGPSVNGSVQASYKIFNASISVFSADIALPTNSRKEFFIYVYPQGAIPSLNVSLIVHDKAVVQTNIKVRTLSSDNRLIGLLSDTPSAYNILTEIQTSTGRTRVVQLEPSRLPELSQGWEALDVIVISGVDTGEFSPAQQNALEVWVAKGGSLLVSGGPKWRENTAGLGELLPVKVTGTTAANSPPDLQGYTKEIFPDVISMILATGDLTVDAQVLAEQEGHPFLIQKSLGRGQVIFFAADPSLAPLHDWGGMKELYDYLLNFQVAPTSWASGQWDLYTAYQALATISELGVPSVFFICGWIVLYILMIGPVNYIFLRIVKRRELAWISIPGLAILFTTVAYFSGYLYRGNDPTLNRITVIQAWDQVEQAESHTLLGIYSPQREQYALESAENFLLYPYNTQDTNLMGNTGWYSKQQEQNVVIDNIPIEIGGMKVIAANGILPAQPIEHTLAFDLSRSMPELTGSITNTGAHALKDAILVTPGSWKNIGDLAPGKPLDVNVSLVAGSNGPAFFTQDSMTILGLSYMDVENNEALSRKNSLLQALLFSRYGVNNMNWGIYLMGWLEEPPLSANVSNVEPRIFDTTFYIHQLTPGVRAQEGIIKLPAAMFRWESSSLDATPYNTYESQDGEFSLKFRPAIPLQFTSVISLTLHVNSHNPPSNMTISLWDHELESWIPMENIFWGSFTVQNPERYVNRVGEVRLKVDDDQNAWVEMTQSNITLEVQP